MNAMSISSLDELVAATVKVYFETPFVAAVDGRLLGFQEDDPDLPEHFKTTDIYSAARLALGSDPNEVIRIVNLALREEPAIQIQLGEYFRNADPDEVYSAESILVRERLTRVRSDLPTTIERLTPPWQGGTLESLAWWLLGYVFQPRFYTALKAVDAQPDATGIFYQREQSRTRIIRERSNAS
jgi:hypothetical protein